MASRANDGDGDAEAQTGIGGKVASATGWNGMISFRMILLSRGQPPWSESCKCASPTAQTSWSTNILPRERAESSQRPGIMGISSRGTTVFAGEACIFRTFDAQLRSDRCRSGSARHNLCAKVGPGLPRLRSMKRRPVRHVGRSPTCFHAGSMTRPTVPARGRCRGRRRFG